MKTEKQQAAAAAAFAKRWAGRGYERGESQSFWLDLLSNVFGVETPTDGFITFEDHRMVDASNFIDARIPSTRVLIEQKSLGKDLRKGIVQSDGQVLTPFLQARRYVVSLPVSEHPRWIVTCNFAEFLVYDMERPNGEPESILLENLEREYYRLKFLVDVKSEHLSKEMEVSIKAGQMVGLIYDKLLAQYIDPTNAHSLKSLNILCVRLVFCLYCEDSGVFGRHDMFHDYLVQYSPEETRNALIRLFQVLNTPLEDRDPYMTDALAAFPYVSGGLFEEENVEIPRFTPEICTILLQNASLDFDWSDISPTIFGAVFESTLNPETRRSGGMHYTSVENIHKVIDPLFLDDLNEELNTILEEEKVPRQREKKLTAFQDKLASLTFLDPACGSGNFLTETYLSLRRLENKALLAATHGQTMLGDFIADPIRVNIRQFYGIEINDFAVVVAKTALWISEAQMMHETERIIQRDLEFLPLRNYANIHEANALRVDWGEIVPKEKLNYIMGNPPFVGAYLMSKGQHEDLIEIFGKKWKNIGEMDYVTGWYKKASDLMKGSNIKAALVSTNSICQGEQVANIWKPLFGDGVRIIFAYRTFRWDSEASIKAHVHCIIVGFTHSLDKCQKIIYCDSKIFKVNNINAYLMDSPDVFIASRSKPLYSVPPIRKGNQPTDGGNLVIEASELDDFLLKEPKAHKFLKRLVGAKEFINNKPRYCLWLKDASPLDLRSMPLVIERISKVREMRLASSDPGARKMAETPHLFRETNNPASFIIVPSHSSENRRYIPMGFMGSDFIPTNAVLIIPDATLYHFGVLESNVHMAWMRAVCGRLKSDYRYSKDIVYNNFPWPTPTYEQKEHIEQTAQAILDARALYPDSSLADLYDELTMPVELRKAHQDNDRAVMAAYGFDVKTMTESQCVAELFKLYQKLTDKE
jgi:hypothetical protein